MERKTITKPGILSSAMQSNKFLFGQPFLAAAYSKPTAVRVFPNFMNGFWGGLGGCSTEEAKRSILGTKFH